ncbi:MAG: aspartate/glutamate racemase family protein [Candidatus Thorarchaeota archaeon]|jgi:allantoin racemase
MKRIALIGATGIDWWVDEKKRGFVKLHTPEGYEIVNYTPKFGTHSVESHVDEAYNAPFILEQIVKAEKDGCDAIVIDCACDPVLDAAREVCQVPVVAPRNSALHVALTLGTKFSIITVQGQSLSRCMKEGVRKEGLESFCASVRHLRMPVLDIPKNPKETQKELLGMCKRAIDEDGADVIVLGCTALSHEVDLEPIMEETGVPVLDPWVIAIRMAHTLVETGLTHSKVAYPTPPRKGITEIPEIEGAFDDVLKSE